MVETESLADNTSSDNFQQRFEWHESRKQTESGEIPYRYTHLTGLKNRILKGSLPNISIPGMSRAYSVSRNFETDIITLFRTTGLFEFRNRWKEGVKAVEEISHYLPRVGMKCKCIFEEGNHIISSSNYTFHSERIEFLETDEKTKNVSSYLLEKIDDNTTRLTISFYTKRNFLSKIFSASNKNLETSAERSLERLDSLVREVEFPY